MSAKNPNSPSGRPGRAGWRRRPETATGGGRAPGRKAAGWTEKKDDEYVRALRHYRVKVAAWSLLFVALLVAFLIWLFWTPMRTPFLAAAVTAYDAPAPPNAWAREDLTKFLELDHQQYLKYSEVPWQSKESGLRQLRQQLEGASPGGPDKNLVIIYLSMHGVVDEKGRPCLLPPGASWADSSQWLPLCELLEQLFPKGDRPGKQPDSVKKLLILDSNRMEADWGLGLLYNGFADRLQTALDEAKVPNLAVLNSTSPGQIGHAAAELKHSVFGYFFWQGLKGAADAEQTGNSDGTVSLKELYNYLKAQVGQWVRENRSDVQQPMLLPRGADFPLVYAQSSEKTAVGDPATADDPRWDEVYALWETHAALLEKQPRPWHLSPLQWEEFQHKLLRLEQLLQAGEAYEAEYDDTKRQLYDLAGALERDPAGEHLAAYSLPLARQMRRWPDGVAAAAQLRVHLEPPPKEPKPETGPEKPPKRPEVETGPENPPKQPEVEGGSEKPPKQPEVEGGSENPPKQPEPKPQPKPEPALDRPCGYLAASAAAWDRLLKQGVREDELAKLLAFVDNAGRTGRGIETDLIEIHFLRMLKAYLDWPVASGYAQRAVLARNLAEVAAAPADQRVHYWIQPLVNRADNARRIAEDELFIGAPDALQRAGKLWSQAAGAGGSGGTYAEAINQAKQIAAAFELRDRAWAETPYLAQWLLSRLHKTDTSQLDDLEDLIESAHDLGSQLDFPSGGHGTSPPDGRLTVGKSSAEKAVREKLQRLRKDFRSECSKLADAGDDKQTLRGIDNVLAVPLVTGPQRNSLRRKYLRIARRKVDVEGTGRRTVLTEDAAGQAASAAQKEHLARLTRRDRHPLLAILSRTKLAEDEGGAGRLPRRRSADRTEDDRGAELVREVQIKKLAEEGKDVRQLIQSVRKEADKWTAETAKLLKLGDLQRSLPTAVRAGRSRADRLVRAAAAVLGRQPWDDTAITPTHQLRKLDLYYLVLWHCRRALDDFWGPTPGSRQPFFPTVAADYLNSARGLCPNTSAPRYGKDVGNLPELLKKRKAAAEIGVRPVRPEYLVVDKNESLLPHRLSVGLAEDLPPGEAAVYLQLPEPDQQPVPLLSKKKEPVRRMEVPVTGTQGTEGLEYLVPNNQLLQGRFALKATAFYRGHVNAAPVVIQPSEGINIVSQPPDYHLPEITVKGKARQRNAVMFILDCSGSMGKPVVVERRQSTRFAEARGTLQEILGRLVDPDRPYDVGLRVYGHRAGWRQGEPGIWSRDPKNPRKFIRRPSDFKPHPADDVELVLELGRFKKDEFNAVCRDLAPLKPLGETPLYLAIIQAIKDLSSGTAAEQSHIIAITDGLNEQSSGGRQGKKYRLDVEKELTRRRGIRLDIVGFQIGQEARLTEFKDLAELTGGTFHDVKEPSDLLAALADFLELSQYVVLRAADGRPVTDKPRPLGMTCVVQQPEDRTADYIVRLLDPERPAQAAVTLKGGESLELYLREGPRRLVHQRYGKDLQAGRLDETGRLFIGSHLREWQGDAVRFAVSVQNADQERFSPRPLEAWIEITPAFPPEAAKKGPVYTFYDMQFEPSRPVPVLNSLAPNWPVEATRAKIQLWCKFKKTTPEKMVSVGALEQNPIEIDGVAFEAKRGENPAIPSRVIVTERHPPGADLYSIKVEMDPPPRHAVHRYIPKTGTVRHVFFYDEVDPGKLARDYSARFTTRKRLRQQAFALDDPLEVRVPRR